MPDTLLILSAVAALVGGVLVVMLAVALSRLSAVTASADAARREAADLRTQLEVLKAQSQDFERDLRQELSLVRQDQSTAAQGLRSEVGERLAQFTVATKQEVAALSESQSRELKGFSDRLVQFTGTTQQLLGDATRAQAEQAKAGAERLALLTQTTEQRLDAVRTTIDQRLEAVRAAVEQRLDLLRSENAKKLDEMRATVDEKLQTTLEARLGESFKLVSERLEQVHKGLGEMQSLATGVGDLKRVLTNVKTRGTWGEVQLGALLADLLPPGQFEQNVATRPGAKERVEYAVRFPGRSDDGAPCWLPIDCKFPLEAWQRLQDGIEHADPEAVEVSRKELERFFKVQAKDIRDKYVAPPHTTDFAILFVPTEGLFAEAVARPGLADALQREYRVSIAGPTTLAAMLNSLQLGFRTLAIEKRSTEVWRVLGAVKTEFLKFGDILAKTKKKLDEAANTIDDAGRKSTTIARKLRDVEALPLADADRLLDADASSVIDAEPSDAGGGQRLLLDADGEVK